MSELWQVAIVGPKSDLLDIENHLQGLVEPPLSFSLFDDELPDWRLQIIFAQQPAKQINDLDITDHLRVDIKQLPEKNWVTESLRYLTYVRAGRFYIHGSHEEASDQLKDVCICIPAGMAFGTGHHETTSGCLIELDKLLLAGIVPSRVLDLGTGAGILAIAAAMTLPANIIATDIDPEAIEVARNNVQINGVQNKIELIIADGVEHPALQPGRFDLVFANILAAPLIDMASGISSLLAPGGTLILAGLLETQAEAVTSAYIDSGLQLLRLQHRGEWAVLTMGA